MEDMLDALRYPIGRYQAPVSYDANTLREWIGVIEALPKWLDICIENLDEPQLHTPYRPGGWTINQVIHHLADSHMNAFVRMKLALTEDNPTVKPYKEELWANLPDTSDVPVNVSITLLHAMHRRWVTLLRHMKAEDWTRTFHHPEHNKDIPLWQLAAMYAWHSRHHMEHVRRLRKRMNW